MSLVSEAVVLLNRLWRRVGKPSADAWLSRRHRFIERQATAALS